MLAFPFFSGSFATRFRDWLGARGIDAELRELDGVCEVLIDEDTDAGQIDEIEREYDALLDEQAAAINAEDSDGPAAISRVGVQYSRADGSIGQVRLPAETVNRIMRELSVSELQALVQTIADEIERGGDATLCER
ncbi:MAG: hypothetical protein KDG50_03615 [Chromatiales bacterium]|nr:hypothetical protein [Chromatiales bacterium]